MKIVFSKDAKKDLERVNEFIAIKNPEAARRIVIKLIEGIKYLITFPDIGTPVEDSPNPDSIRDIYILNYHVRYLKLKESIYIIRIWHQKEDR